MKYRLLIIVVALLLLVTGIAGYFYLKPEKNKPVTASTFYYYPKPNVYYNIEDNTYTFWDANNAVWVTNQKLPDSLIIELDKKVILHNPPMPVWKNNEKDRMLYAVYFYADSADFKEKPVIEAKDTITTHKAVVKKKAPHESFFKRLVKKIFKKKDKQSGN